MAELAALGAVAAEVAVDFRGALCARLVESGDVLREGDGPPRKPP